MFGANYLNINYFWMSSGHSKFKGKKQLYVKIVNLGNLNPVKE